MRGQRLGPYQIEEEIGRGGMGIVYKATQPRLKRTVAVKVLPAELVGRLNAVERFLREARAAARLDHPNIVTIHDVGESGGIYYFAMQYLPGINLEELIAERGRIPLAEVMGIARQLAAALGYAHRKGVIHRDVKPSNIILHEEDQLPLLTDFGIALAATDSRLTESGKIFGSPVYMSPEQLEGKDLDHRSDLYSLGAVIFEMVAGVPPFRGNSAVAILNNRLRKPDRSLSELDLDLPPSFDAVVCRLMAIRVEDRFQDAAEVLSALELLSETPDFTGEPTGPTGERTVPIADPLLDTPAEQQLPKKEDQPEPVQAVEKDLPREATLPPAPAAVPTRRAGWHWWLWLLIPAALLLLVWLVPNWPDGSSSVRSSESGLTAEEPAHPTEATGSGSAAEPPAFLADPDSTATWEKTHSAKPMEDSVDSSILETEPRYQEQQSFDSGAEAITLPPPRGTDTGRRPGEEITFEISPNIRMEFVWIPAGRFFMGSPGKEKGRQDDEGPLHAVEITRGFWIGKHEVTQAEWTAVIGRNPSTFSGSRRPVENVTWNEAQEFIRRLNRNSSTWIYQLPTEAEWEFCCRSGSTAAFHTGSCLSSSEANCDGRFSYDDCDDGKRKKETTNVGSYPPNAWKLYDMHGNVLEWCADWYSENGYSSSPGKNPIGERSGSRRVIRGGSWNQGAQRCRSADRQYQAPGFSDENLGFRVVRVAR